MKQNPFVVLTACMLFISVISNAQIKQGEKMLGGNISFSNYNDETKDADNKYTDSRFNITPQLGFGLANNWVLGIQAGYNTRKETEEDTDWEGKTSGFSVGVFARKFKPFNEYCGIFGQGSFDYGFGKIEDSDSDLEDDDKFNSISVQVRPGLYFYPTKKLIVEATFGQLGYTTYKETNDEDDYEYKENEFAISILDGLSFGVKIIL